MQFLILSDIHGSAASLGAILDAYTEQSDGIIICGDYLNHGPRNPLPDGWDTKKTAELLNSVKEKIICVRGNCDSEVDQMMLEFPCLNAYTNIFIPSGNSLKRIFIHHGHLYDRNALAELLPEGTLVISGHTHVTAMEEENGMFYFNPGSISLPKCKDGKTFGILAADGQKPVRVSLCSLDGTELRHAEW